MNVFTDKQSAETEFGCAKLPNRWDGARPATSSVLRVTNPRAGATIMLQWRNWFSVARMLVLAAVLGAFGAHSEAQVGDAKSILKAMSDYVGRLQTIEYTFDSDIEIITPELEKIQFTNSGEALLRRPDKLRAHRMGGHADVALYFDGKTAMIYGKNIDGYAQFDAPGTVDQLIAGLREGHGISLPGADLLMSNSYDGLIAGVLDAKRIGHGIVDGHLCEHLAFRNFDTDWQIWVETGDRPIPRKMVITSKTMNAAPQYTVRVKSWKTDVIPAPDAFVFRPPATARKLDPNDLSGLDELPPEAPR